MRESRDRCGQASEAGWEPEPRILSKGRSGVKKTETSHAARADTVPRPRKKRAGPPAGQLLRAEPDFGTGKNFVLPFPSAQGRMLSFYPELTEPARRPSTGRVVLLRPGGREPVCLSGEVNMARYGLPGAPPPAARPKTRSPRGAARGRPYPSHPYPSLPYPSHPFLAQGRRRGVLNALIPPPPVAAPAAQQRRGGGARGAYALHGLRPALSAHRKGPPVFRPGAAERHGRGPLRRSRLGLGSSESPRRLGVSRARRRRVERGVVGPGRLPRPRPPERARMS